MFLGGFSEMMGKQVSKKSLPKFTDSDSSWNGETVELTFDDPNITRAAFE